MKRVKLFLETHWDQERPLLLGYSGGPDSKALLYALLEAGCNNLHVAHVDHGWRGESAREEALIRREIEGLKLPYYSTRLNIVAKEAVAREGRLDFFRSLFEKIPYQALILGHQADDLAETILKRIFEGAHLSFLGGMEPVSVLDWMPIWRPLLKTSKKELVAFLDGLQLKPLIDPTNFDPVYLRSRLRQETIPFLDQSFGKNIGENLSILSERSHELKQYLDQKIAHLKVQREEGRCTVFCEKLERIERRHLLQKVAAEEKVFFTRVVLEQILDWVDDKAKQRKVFIDSRWIVSGRGKVIFDYQHVT